MCKIRNSNWKFGVQGRNVNRQNVVNIVYSRSVPRNTSHSHSRRGTTPSVLVTFLSVRTPSGRHLNETAVHQVADTIDSEHVDAREATLHSDGRHVVDTQDSDHGQQRAC